MVKCRSRTWSSARCHHNSMNVNTSRRQFTAACVSRAVNLNQINWVKQTAGAVSNCSNILPCHPFDFQIWLNTSSELILSHFLWITVNIVQVQGCSTWNGHELPKRTTWKGVKHDSAEVFLGLTEEYSRWVARSKSIRPVSVTWTCFNLHLSQVWWWGDDVQDGNNDDNEDDLKPLDLHLSQVATETELHLTWEETTKQEQRQRGACFSSVIQVVHIDCCWL